MAVPTFRNHVNDISGVVRVLVLDDRSLYAGALGALLSSAPEIELVGVLTAPSELVAHARVARPDVLLVPYVTLATHDVAALAEAARQELPALKLLVLTQADDKATVLTCARSGAAGYLTHDRPAAELARAIRRIHAGEVLFPVDVLVDLLQRAPQRRPTTGRGTLGAATERELEVLRLLASGASTEDIAARLRITVHTVRTHLKHVMAKLDAHSKTEAVIVALRAGLIQFSE